MGYHADVANESTSLIDPFNRRIDYVRVSVTDRCNLRCFYCLPKDFKGFESRDDYLSYEEIERILRAFTRLGVRRIRLTGGEPLARRDLHRLVEKIAALPGAEDISLSTNAVLLAKHASALHRAGVSRLNVSLDTLRADRFREITGNGDLDQVLDGLEAARRAGFAPIKINMVAMKGVNDDEFIDMVEYCGERGFSLRFIETMPVGDTGRDASSQYLDLSTVREMLDRHYSLTPSVMPGGGPAQYFRVEGSDLHIGFITPISQHFCETCNRVRLSVDGVLYLCLGQDHSYPLRPLLRAGVSDGELENAIVEALALKPERHEFREKPDQVVRFMSSTGG